MPVSGIDESDPKRLIIQGEEFAWIEEPAQSTAGTTTIQNEPALVLIHGFTGHRDDFIEVMPDLAKHQRVVAPDLRGHGDSVKAPGEKGWGFPQLVQDLINLLDALEIERCDLFGHSMGGMLTLRFALAHPDRIRSLIFMCTAPESPESLSRSGFEAGAHIADARGINELQELMEYAGRANCSKSIARWGERYWTHHRRRIRAMTPESFRGLGTAFFDSESLVARLPEIEAPSSILVGEYDADFLPGADLFEAHLPHAIRETLPDAEHHPHQENLAAWREAMERHWARSTSTRELKIQ